MAQPGNELERHDVQLPATVAGANLVPLAEAGGIVTADTYWQPADGAEPIPVYGDAFLGNLRHLASDRSGYRDSLEEPAPGTGFKVVVSQTAHGPVSVHVRPEQDDMLVQAMAYDRPTGTVSWNEGFVDDDRVLVAQDRGIYGEENTGGSSLRQVLAGPDSAGSNLALFEDEHDRRRPPIGNPGIRSGIIRVIDPVARQARYYALGVEFIGEADSWTVRGGVVEVEPMVLTGQAQQTTEELDLHSERLAITAE